MIRDYQASDYPDLLEISKHIWQGEDYLPRRINDYVVDPNSHPMVAVENGRVIAIANIRFLTPKIAWLEALRSHPEIRGKGFATELTRKMLDKARLLGAEEAWLLSNAENRPAQRIIEKMAFNEMILLYMWPNWDVMDASLKRLNLDNFHVARNVTGLKNLFDKNLETSETETPYTALVKSLPLSNEAKRLSKSWNRCQSMEQVVEVVNSIEKGGGINMVTGEFIVYPVDAQIVDSKIKEGAVYYLEKPPAIATFQKSGEISGGTGIGLNTPPNVPEALESLLFFVSKTWPDLIYWLFYPSTLIHPFIKPGFHRQRVMRKKLI
ncbi:MAG: GNAT family N-acetyltransferase [Candidatus Odinarchaeota archaeon]